MNDPKVQGTVHLIEETKSFGQKGFRKRLVVLEQPGSRFQNFIPVEFLQDACDQVDALQLGDEIEVTYRLSGRKWQRDANSEVKFFLSCEASAFRLLGDRAPDSIGGTDVDPNAQFDQAAFEDDDEIPF
ncbi:MAG: DUF3127 domain-containing protein [Planctomycetales bacterium]|nr:DUF3127 domain-containing protein [Planctomycetales bacterium]